MSINEYLKKHKVIREVSPGYFVRNLTPRVMCADGFNMSVQVSDAAYCNPRENDASHYEHMEIGFPSETEPMIMKWAENENNPTGTVYGYVPYGVVDQVIQKHGGIKQ